MDLSRLQAVLLDMDGTLVDSDAAVERSWQTWAAEYPVDPGRGPLIAHGLPALANVRRLLPDLSEDEAAAAAQYQLELEYVDVADIAATPGAHELLGELDRLGLPWAVVTSADPPLARTRLAAAGIRPALLVTIDDVRAGKPDPEGYLLALDALRKAARPLPTGDHGHGNEHDLLAEHCLVIEDSLAGVASAKGAGMWAVGITHTYTAPQLRQSGADAVIHGLDELTPDWIDRQFAKLPRPGG